ncbi:MAG: MmgE/PrpD family protein [Janthinobacterium lividum]
MHSSAAQGLSGSASANAGAAHHDEAGLTSSIVRFITGFDASTVPAAALSMARAGFIDLLGTMLAARQDPLVAVLRQAISQDVVQQPVSSLLLDSQQRVGAAAAAFVNASIGHVLDYDDVAHGAHPSTVLVPAILAEAERIGASGHEVLCAYLVGYEVWGEFARREKNSYHNKGWHPTSVMGPVAAAASLSYLLKLDASACRDALGIAASLSGGVIANFGTMVKPVHAGQAAAAAVNAVAWARLGLHASPVALEAPGGLLQALSPKGNFDATSPSLLGDGWYALRLPLSFKKYPVCYASHATIDRVLAMRQAQAIDSAAIARIVLTLRPTFAKILRHHQPVTGAEAKFSAEFAVASTLLTGRVGLNELDVGFINRADIQALMRRIAVQAPAAPAAAYQGVSDTASSVPAAQAPLADRIVMTLQDGSEIDSGPFIDVAPHVDPRGKFLDCCAAGQVADGPSIYEMLNHLESVKDIRQLAQAHRAGA